MDRLHAISGILIVRSSSMPRLDVSNEPSWKQVASSIPIPSVDQKGFVNKRMPHTKALSHLRSGT